MFADSYKKCVFQFEVRVVRDCWRQLDEAPLYVDIGVLGMWPATVKKLDQDLHDGLVLDDLRGLEFFARSQQNLPGKYSPRGMFADGY